MPSRRHAWILRVALLLIIGACSPRLVAPRGSERGEGSWRWEEEIEHLGIDLAYPLEKHEIELNLVSAFKRFQHEARRGKDIAIRAEVEYGLSDRILLELEYTYRYFNPHETAGGRSVDVEIEGKYLYFNNNRFAASFGLAAGVKFEEPAREPFVELFFPVSYTLSDHFRYHLVFGQEWSEDGETERLLGTAFEYRPIRNGCCFKSALTWKKRAWSRRKPQSPPASSFACASLK